MENLEEQKKYRAVRDAINGLFNDGYCHTLQEIAEVTKMVSVTAVGKDKDGKAYEKTIQVRSGFNEICIKKLVSIALVRSIINDPDYSTIFEKTLSLPKYRDRKGRTPKFFLIAQAPKMSAKDKDDKRIVTTRQIELCYEASHAASAESYAKEMDAKRKQFEELQAIQTVSIWTDKYPVTKDQILQELPHFVKGGCFATPKITRSGLYQIKIRFGKNMIHELYLRVGNTTEAKDKAEVVESVVSKLSLEDCIKNLREKAKEMGLICEIMLK